LYDYGIETNAPDNDYQICEPFAAALASTTPLETTACFQGNCPSKGNDLAVCPSGFWGYRHAIGTPMDVRNGPPTATVVGLGSGRHLTVGVSTDVALVERAKHVEVLSQLCESRSWHYADTRRALFEELRTAPSQLVYLYCHAGVQNRVPGSPTSRWDHWRNLE
jgi:hypothetical protein